MAIDKAEFDSVHKRLLRKTHEKANAEIDAAEARATLTNAEFDTKSDHGRNAGTKLDLSAAEPEVTEVPG